MGYARGLFAFCVIVAPSCNAAASTRLICGGTYTQGPPNPIEAKVGPGATVVDIEAGLLSTPIGKFRITQSAQDAITFDSPDGKLKVFGRMDRFTGEVMILERTPEEEAKMRAGQSSVAAVVIQLHCSAAKPLF